MLLVVETMSSRVDWKKKRRPSVKPSAITLMVKVVVDNVEEDGDDVELVEVLLVLVLLVTRVVPLPVGVFVMVEVVVLVVELVPIVMMGGGLGFDPGTLLTVKTISVQTDKSKKVVASPAKSETSPATSTQVKKTSSMPFRKQDRLPSSLTTQTMLSCSMMVITVSSD